MQKLVIFSDIIFVVYGEKKKLFMHVLISFALEFRLILVNLISQFFISIFNDNKLAHIIRAIMD